MFLQGFVLAYHEIFIYTQSYIYQPWNTLLFSFFLSHFFSLLCFSLLFFSLIFFSKHRETSLPGNRIQQMLRIPVPVKIPFPSEHLSGAIDSEAEHEEEEDEEEDEKEDEKEEDVKAASSGSNSGSGGVLPNTVMEELSSTSSSAASGMPITQPNDDSQESQDPMEEVRAHCFL